jgi:hypothetical protein
MYTAMALVALTMGNLTTSPKWLDDYRAAQAQVTVAGKPMAVFVGTGKDGHVAAIRDGFDPAVSRLLAEKFVCLYVDRSTPAGQKLAGAFQVGDRGIVLSDRTGLTQAYSVSGTISRAELSRALIAYGDVEVAQKTDSPKSTTSGTTSGSSTGTAGTTSGGAVMTAPGAMPGGVMVGPGPGMMMGQPYMGQPYMTQPYMGGPVMGGPAMMGSGYGYGGGGCGQGGYGGGGHGCCFLGGFMSKCGFGGGCGQQAHCAPAPMMAAPVAHQGGCGQSQGCGMGGHGFGGGSKCCGLFGGFGGGMGHGCGGFGGGWGGGFGGGMGHGCGGCK